MYTITRALLKGVLQSTEDAISCITKTRDVVDSWGSHGGLDAFMDGFVYTYWESYLALIDSAMIQIILALNAACFCTTILTVTQQDPSIPLRTRIQSGLYGAAIVCISIAMIVVVACGLMGLVGLMFNGMTAIAILMAIGMADEYTTHTIFMFLLAEGSHEDRIANAMHHIRRGAGSSARARISTRDTRASFLRTDLAEARHKTMAAELETMISEFCSIKMGDWIAGNTTDDFQFVRPTGNPIDKIGFPAMMTGDVVVQAGELKKIHKLEARRLRRTHRSRRARDYPFARERGSPSPRESLSRPSRRRERTGFVSSCREPLARCSRRRPGSRSRDVAPGTARATVAPGTARGRVSARRSPATWRSRASRSTASSPTRARPTRTSAS